MEPITIDPAIIGGGLAALGGGLVALGKAVIAGAGILAEKGGQVVKVFTEIRDGIRELRESSDDRMDRIERVLTSERTIPVPTAARQNASALP